LLAAAAPCPEAEPPSDAEPPRGVRWVDPERVHGPSPRLLGLQVSHAPALSDASFIGTLRVRFF
jgi:hypothetical protein